MFPILYADPPWSYRDNGANGAAARHYPTMSDRDLQALQPPGDTPGWLFLWATWPRLDSALDLIRAWGYTYRTVGFLWVKTNPRSGTIRMGLGHYSRGNSEPCLLATRGKVRREDRAVHSVVMAPQDLHSRKPPEVRDRIVRLCGDLPRLELFAREQTPGWEVWGNQVAPTVAF